MQLLLGRGRIFTYLSEKRVSAIIGLVIIRFLFHNHLKMTVTFRVVIIRSTLTTRLLRRIAAGRVRIGHCRGWRWFFEWRTSWVVSLAGRSASLLVPEVTLGESFREQLEVARYLNGTEQISVAVALKHLVLFEASGLLLSDFVVLSDKDWHVHDLFGRGSIFGIDLE